MNGYKYRTVIQDNGIDIGFSGYVSVTGQIQAFNKNTNQWEQIGRFTRELNGGARPPWGYNAYMMMGQDAGFDNPFANKAKNGGFTSVFNPHAFTWLKASGFKRQEVSAAADGTYVWSRSGFRQPRDRAEQVVRNMEEELRKYRIGEASIIRTDLDADMVEYLAGEARRKNFAKSAPQHPEFILAMSNNGKTKEERDAREEEIMLWFQRNAPFGRGEFAFTNVNVPDDPRV
jgi:hypothetical protein